MKGYIKLMVESLEKKIGILDEIQGANEEQSALLKAEQFDQEAFDRAMDVKAVQIEQLNKLDEGFDSLYERVRDYLLGHKEECRAEIARLQELIGEISKRSASIQVTEQRNRSALEKVMNQENGRLRLMRNKNRLMQSYATNMQQVNLIDPQFMDRKK